MKKILVFLFLVFMIGGCSTTNQNELNTLALYRSASLNNSKSVSYNSLKFINAKSSKNLITLNFLYSGGNPNYAKRFTEQYSKSFCQNLKLKEIIQKGIQYRIQVLTMNGQKISVKFISSC